MIMMQILRPFFFANFFLLLMETVCIIVLISTSWRQSCQTPIRPITPSRLLDSICWSISEPTSTACIYTESSEIDGSIGQHTSEFFDARVDVRDLEASFDNFSRPLRER